MGNEIRKITLTQLGTNAGPNFGVQWSVDCINYSQSIDCSNVFLPSVNSFAYCTVDENSVCIKLTSLSEVCGNSVIENLSLTTTTTTATPTTSTTTLTPTTSTTTLTPTTTTTLVPTTTTTSGPTTSTTTVTPTTSTTTTLACYSCNGGTIRFETSATSQGSYPTKDVCSTSAQCGTFVYDAIDRPNRFNLYDSTGLIGTSGWVGYANYAGPWGSSLNVTPNGSFSYQFNSTSGRYVLVEYGNADPFNPQSDAADWSLTCGTCPTTTTTQAPTTTTIAPTTSTTTACPSCTAYEFTQTSPNPSITYVDCYGVNRSIDWVNSAVKRRIAARSITSVTNASQTSLGAAYGFDCNNYSLDVCNCINTQVTQSKSPNYSGVGRVYYRDCVTGTAQEAVIQNATTDIDFAGCVVSGSLILPTNTLTNRYIINTGSSCSTCPTTTTTTTQARLLDWSFTESGGANGNMIIWLNGSQIENRSTNSSGTWPLSVGDQIYFEVSTSGCSGGSNYANSYTLVPGVPSYAVLADASCATSNTTLTTGTYTVQSSDGTIYVDAFSTCDAGCV